MNDGVERKRKKEQEGITAPAEAVREKERQEGRLKMECGEGAQKMEQGNEMEKLANGQTF